MKFILNFAATIITDRENGRSKGFGFVTFYDGRHVQDVIDQLHQKVNTVDIRPSYKINIIMSPYAHNSLHNQGL